MLEARLLPLAALYPYRCKDCDQRHLAFDLFGGSHGLPIRFKSFFLVIVHAVVEALAIVYVTMLQNR